MDEETDGSDYLAEPSNLGRTGGRGEGRSALPASEADKVESTAYSYLCLNSVGVVSNDCEHGITVGKVSWLVRLNSAGCSN
jgi:hypothetical protein